MRVVVEDLLFNKSRHIRDTVDLLQPLLGSECFRQESAIEYPLGGSVWVFDLESIGIVDEVELIRIEISDVGLYSCAKLSVFNHAHLGCKVWRKFINKLLCQLHSLSRLAGRYLGCNTYRSIPADLFTNVCKH